MKRLRKLLIAIFVLVAVAAAVAQQYDTAAEEEIFRLVNEDRAQAGLNPLELDPQLTEIARRHTELMVQHKTLSHDFPGEPDLLHRVIASGIRFETSGENVALDVNAASAENALMHSPPHRKNILTPDFNAIGVGVIRVGNSIYVTQDFAHRLKDFTPAEAENAVAQAFAALRKSAGTPPLKRVQEQSLRPLACQMARNDRLESDLARSLPNVKTVIAWTASDPRKLPDDMQRIKGTTASGWSVGACFASSPKYPNPVWWIVAVTYF